jgi:hypothetical protein
MGSLLHLLVTHKADITKLLCAYHVPLTIGALKNPNSASATETRFPGRAFRVANNSSPATNNVVPHLNTWDSPTHPSYTFVAHAMAGNMLKGEPL